MKYLELYTSEGSSPLDSSSDAGGDELIPFPPLRATSEPPLELDDHQSNLDGRITHSLKTSLPIQEYSWEWGAFPQPSPVQTNFGKGRRFEGATGTRRDTGIGNGHLKVPTLSSHGRATEEDSKSHRSHSVPPELEGSPRMQRRELPVFEGGYNHEGHRESRESRSDGFGSGGRLAPSKTEPTQFTVYIEKQKLGFELSRVSFGVDGPPKEEDEEDKRGRRNRGGSTNQTKALYGLDEVEAARIFDEGKVTYDCFLDDSSIVADERLVIRWSGDQCV
jgi:phosphatidate phosphatase LPIN